MLKLHNSLTRTVQDFVPIEPGRVRMYVCGMTIYDLCHIGHARMMLAFDMITRWLRASGYEVTYVRNITDIDDKIIKRAAENGETIRQLTDRQIALMHEDIAALGGLSPDHEPRATEYVGQMIGLIEQLMQNGLAYVADNGDVCYSVRKFPGYGKLSGKSLEDLRAGERVNVQEGKQDPLDFVLWKSAKPDEPEAAKWASPWGIGRPGWHIECSAMSADLLGNHFDIHGGGQDLQFPHHENEIAQSEGAHGGIFVNYWLHNGFVRVDNEKMSKSLGNFFTIRDVLKKYKAEVVRFFILRAHYRSPLNYSDAHLDDANRSLTRLYTALNGFDGVAAVDWNDTYAQRFRAAMDNDFGTPEAMEVLFDLAGEVNRTKDAGLALQLKALGGVLGLLQQSPPDFLQGRPQHYVLEAQTGQFVIHGGVAELTVGLSDANIDKQIAARIAAKKARNFAEADRIRDELKAAGIVLEDSAAGTTWRRA